MTQSSGRAEDLVQSCLVRALNKQHLWREGTDLRAWLFTILHNEFVSQTRRLALERDYLPTATTTIGAIAMPGSDPEIACQLSELRA